MAIDYGSMKRMLNAQISEARRLLEAIEVEERASADTATEDAFAPAPGTGTPPLTRGEVAASTPAPTAPASEDATRSKTARDEKK